MKIECPNCFAELELDSVIVDTNKLKNVEYYQQQLLDIQRRKDYLKSAKDQAYQKIYTTTKSVNIGFIAERIIPALSTFPHKHSDCRSTGGDPIDYVVFNGLSEGQVTEILFIDVKTGNAILTKRQQEIRDIINKQKNVKFRTF